MSHNIMCWCWLETQKNMSRITRQYEASDDAVSYSHFWPRNCGHWPVRAVNVLAWVRGLKVL